MKETTILFIVALYLPTVVHGNEEWITHEPTITLPLARLMVKACEELAAREGYPPIGIAISDQHVNIKLSVRQDGAPAGVIKFAQLKARSAAGIGANTSDMRLPTDAGAENTLVLMAVEGYANAPGGRVVSLEDGTILGGVGVAGGGPEVEEKCAQAAVDSALRLIEAE